MQTLSFKTSQAAAQSGLAEVVSKGNLNGNRLSSGSEKTPFQHELNRQVQAKKHTSEAVQPKSVSPKNQSGNQPGNQPVSQSQAAENASAKAGKLTTITSGETTEKQPADVSATSYLDAASMLLAMQAAGKVDNVDLSKALNEKEKVEAEGLSTNGVESSVATLGGEIANLAMPLQPNQAKAASLTDEAGVDVAGEHGVNLKDGTIVQTEARPRSVEVVNNQPQSKGVDNAPEVKKDVADNAFGKLQGSLDNSQDKATPKAVGADVSAAKVVTNVASESTSKEFSNVMTTASPSPAMQPNTVQAASVSNLAAAQQAGSSAVINAYPGKAGWDQAISQKVVWMAGAGEQSATLTLNPPELGPLKVVIQVHNDQADATFISDNDEVRRALESGISNLREKMNESGIQLGQASVSTSSQSQQNFQQAGQGRSAGRGQGDVQVDATQSDTVMNERVSVRAGNGLVDTFA